MYDPHSATDAGAYTTFPCYPTAILLGDAAHTGRHALQDLKKVWHYLACFGDQSDVE